MPVPTADSLVIVMTYAQARRLISVPIAARIIHPKGLLAHPSAFCARALTLPALDRAKGETFANHGSKPSNHRRSSENQLHTWTTFPDCLWGPPSLPNTSKHGPCRLTKVGALSSLPPSTLQGDLAKSREEAAAAKAEAQAARAEAAALREHIAKLEAQISTLATGLPAPPTPTPNASQPPPPLPNHPNPDIYANSLELDADAELPQQSSLCIMPDASTPTQ